MTAPKWAQELLLNAVLHLQEAGHKVELPALHWRRSAYHRFSSGRCNLDTHTITVTAGKSRVDSKLAVLHEAAHLAGVHHDSKFWDRAWELYRWAKMPIRYCQKREYTYRAGAAVAYRRSRK